MRYRSALGAALLTFVWTASSVNAGSPGNRAHSLKPSIRIISATASGGCISVKVSVNNFRLVNADIAYSHVLKGNQGFIDYHLSGAKRSTMVKDESSALMHTWCKRDGVKRGTNIVQVFLVTTRDTLFPGTAPLIKILKVK